jgi:zinc transporter ZupT
VLVLRLSGLQLAAQLSCAMVAAMLTLCLGDRFGKVVEWLLPFSVGGFVYLAASSMVPEVREGAGNPLIKFICFTIGILLI